MPLYDYVCAACARLEERQIPLATCDAAQFCGKCGAQMERRLSVAHVKIAGRVLKGGGPDRFTADVLGCRLDELPTGLRTDK